MRLAFLMALAGGLLCAPSIQAQDTPLRQGMGQLETTIANTYRNTEILLRRQNQTYFHLDTVLIQQRIEWEAGLERQLATFETRLLEQLQAQNEAKEPSGPSWLMWAIPTALSVAALVIVLTHHHHYDVMPPGNDGDDITITIINKGYPVIPHPKGCWPPGHCKADKPGR